MKFVLVINSKRNVPEAINASGHVCVAIHKLLNGHDLKLREFRDNEGAVVSMLTDFPLIVLSARNGAHLEEAHYAALGQGIPCSAFFDCMRTGTPEEQEEYVQSRALKEQEYITLALFGSDEQLRPITRRFSLLRANAG